MNELQEEIARALASSVAQPSTLKRTSSVSSFCSVKGSWTEAVDHEPSMGPGSWQKEP